MLGAIHTYMLGAIHTWTLGFGSARMIVSGYDEKLVVARDLTPRWVCWFASVAFFLYIVYELLVGLVDAVIALGRCRVCIWSLHRPFTVAVASAAGRFSDCSRSLSRLPAFGRFSDCSRSLSRLQLVGAT